MASPSLISELPSSNTCSALTAKNSKSTRVLLELETVEEVDEAEETLFSTVGAKALTEKVGNRKGEMFLSKTLFSSKGPLGSVWVAAYCEKRLSKAQVSLTDISSSVDKIMLYRVTISYRVLGYLLLGVVRIYAKKVDSLYHDCDKILARTNKCLVTKRAYPQIEAMSAPNICISLPESFELDNFDIEIPKDVSRRNIRPHEEITLEALEEEAREYFSLNKYHSIEPSFQLSMYQAETFDDAPPPISDLDFVVNMVVSQCQIPSTLEASKELDDMENEFYGEDHAVVICPGETSQESEFPCPVVFDGSEEPLELVPLLDEVGNDQVKRTKFIEMPSLEIDHVSAEDRQLVIASDGTEREPKFPCALGSATPAQKEQVRVSRKRKLVCDDSTTLPGLELRKRSNDSTDLVTQRRKVLHTALDVWRASIKSRIQQDFMDPLLVGVSSELKLFYKRYASADRPAEVAASPSLSVELALETAHKSSEQEGAVIQENANIGRPAEVAASASLSAECCKSSEQRGASFQENANTDELAEVAVCPSHSKELTFETAYQPSEQRAIFQEDFNDASAPANPVEVPDTPMTPAANVEKELSAFVTEDLINENFSPHEEDNQDMDGWTERTRAAARYLHINFLNLKEQKDEEGLSLDSVLKGKTRSGSARLFYEILVLKSKGFVDVKQSNPYDHILVLKTPQLGEV